MTETTPTTTETIVDASADGPTKMFPTVLCTVKKRTSATPVVVVEHEVQILYALHGEDMVEIVDEDYDVLELPADPLLELQRLQRKYDNRGQDIVSRVFPSAAAVASAAGMQFQRRSLKKSVQAEGSFATDKRAERKEAAKKKAAPKASAKA